MKNKKGFTLIELLAVIVVLAIIMVIATMQVNKTIKKSRTKSYYSSALSIEKSAKTACIESNLNNINQYVDKTDDINIEVDGNDIIITAKNDGKFSNIDIELLKKELKTGIEYEESDNYKLIIKDPCGNASNGSNAGENTDDLGNGGIPNKTYIVGDKFCLNDNEECFYTISDNGDTVTALAEWNINENENKQSQNNPTYFKFSEDHYWSDSNYKLLEEYGGKNVLSNVFGYINPPYVFDENSTLMTPLNNYKKYVEKLTNTKVEVRLLKFEETRRVGCDYGYVLQGCANEKYSWIWNTYFWLGSACKSDLVFVIIEKEMVGYPPSISTPLGLRPVITISKTDL